MESLIKIGHIEGTLVGWFGMELPYDIIQIKLYIKMIGLLETYYGYDDYYWIVYHVFCCYKLIGQIDTVLETS